MARRRTGSGTTVLAVALLLQLSWLALPVQPARAQPAVSGTQPLVLTADEIVYAAEAERVTARGNVELAQDGRSLLTDLITYDIAAGTVTARGNIILIEPSGDAIFADELKLDDRLADGFVDGIGVLLADDTRLAAVRGVRSDGARTTLDRAVYSPCEICEDDGQPLWQIKAERVVHDQATQTVAYRNARLELFGVPVLYTPYFYHPDPTVERRTGFLAPTFGTDTELGFTVETPFFIDLAPNRDLVLSPLMTTNGGVLLNAEYRELRRFGLTELGGGVTYTDAAGEREGQNNVRQSGSEVRGYIDSRGRYTLSEQDRAGFDLRLASDNSILQRYDIANDDVLESRAFVERFGNRDFLALNAYGFQTLRDEEDQDQVPIVLPLADAVLYGPRDRFGGQLDWRTSLLGLTRENGLDTRRFSTQVGWQLPHVGELGDVWSLRLALRGDLYNTNGDPETRAASDQEDTTARLVPTVSLDWGLPMIGETGSWSHIIEPRLALNYTPNGVNKNDIPNEDSLDFEFDETNLFATNRFTGIDLVETGTRLAYGLNFDSLGPSPWRVAGLIGQSLRSESERRFPDGSGLEDEVSDIVGRVDLRPAELLDIGYRFRVDKSSLDLRRSDLTLAFGPPRLRFDIQYLRLAKEEEEAAVDDLERREEIVVGLRYQMLDSLAVGVRTRRDLEADRTVTTQYGLVYTNPCLVLVAGLEQNFTRRGELDDEVRFKVRVTFSGLGDLGASTNVF